MELPPSDVMVCGDVMLDKITLLHRRRDGDKEPGYARGSVRKTEHNPGGAANVAAAVARLAPELAVGCVGLVGGDRSAYRLGCALRLSGVRQLFEVCSEIRTTRKHRIYDAENRLVYWEDRDQDPFMGRGWLESSGIENTLDVGSNCVLVAVDHGQGFFGPRRGGWLPSLERTLYAHQGPLIVDLGSHLAMPRKSLLGLSILKMNYQRALAVKRERSDPRLLEPTDEDQQRIGLGIGARDTDRMLWFGAYRDAMVRACPERFGYLWITFGHYGMIIGAWTIGGRMVGLQTGATGPHPIGCGDTATAAMAAHLAKCNGANKDAVLAGFVQAQLLADRCSGCFDTGEIDFSDLEGIGDETNRTFSGLLAGWR